MAWHPDLLDRDAAPRRTIKALFDSTEHINHTAKESAGRPSWNGRLEAGDPVPDRLFNLI